MQTPTAVNDSYGKSVLELADTCATLRYAGDFLVAVDHDRPTGYYEADRAGLGWREVAPFHTVRFDVAVADAHDGRFVPGLTIHLRAEKNGRTLAAGQCGFAPPGFPRDGHDTGRRYCDPVVLRFPRFEVCRTSTV